MKITTGTRSRQEELAFTMVEIALSIAIVAFALVAILGVLPTGLNVQRDNREDTIINQDAQYILECLRSGETNLMQFATNVEVIELTRTDYNPSRVTVTYFTNPPPPAQALTSTQVIHYLTQPRHFPDRTGPNDSTYSVRFKVRSFSGPLAEKGTNFNSRDFAFTYILTPEINPYNFYGPAEVAFPYYYPQAPAGTPPLTPVESAHSNNWTHARQRQNNLFSVRLSFEWPVYPEPPNSPTALMGRSGPGRQAFHTLISSAFGYDTNTGIQHFQPGFYVATNLTNYP